MKPVQIGAGVRIHADCTVGHKNIWDSCEFANKTRTSVLDIMISVFQLTIGLNMSQVILACSVPVYQILQDEFPETKKIAESDFGWTKSS